MPKHPPWDPTEDDLKQFAKDHIAYEVRSLVEQAQAIAAWTGPTNPTADALIEAFLVHTRLLDDFLGKNTPSGDDVLASHYIVDWTAERFLDSDEVDDVNAQIAHLAARRHGLRSWDVSSITNRACDALDAFHGQVPPYRRSYFKQIPWSTRRWRPYRTRAASITTASSEIRVRGGQPGPG